MPETAGSVVVSTKIEWTDETWNPVTGCRPISEGCQNCYAKRMANRLRGRYGYPADDPFRVTFHPDKLGQPLKWKKPKRIFVCSMGDLFAAHFDTIRKVLTQPKTPSGKKHTYMILTKRPLRMLEFYSTYPWYTEDNQNIWLGVTAENQAMADERIPVLLQIPAAVRFVSVEPMLEPVDIRPWIYALDWVICGAETGPGARPMKLEWARDLRDQCKAAGVPFFFKKATGKLIPDDLMIREFPKGE